MDKADDDKPRNVPFSMAIGLIPSESAGEPNGRAYIRRIQVMLLLYQISNGLSSRIKVCRQMRTCVWTKKLVRWGPTQGPRSTDPDA
jgi:hypothetical protein